MPDLSRGQTASAQAWFAGGERVGYDPKARAIVPAGDAPLKIFLSREGDLAQAVSFLPGFPGGSFGWAKVRPHLPNAAEMPKLFVDYVGMGDIVDEEFRHLGRVRQMRPNFRPPE